MDEYAARRGSARLPIGAAIKLRYPGVEHDFDETIGDIGMSGLFVQSESPMPAGTLMHFELRPSPQWRILRGRGRVVWARHQATEAGEPTGMGVRFIELDERARRGIRWLIETYQAVGDRPFETWTVPHQFARPGGVAPASAHVTQRVDPLPPGRMTQQLADEPAERVEGGESRNRRLWLAAGFVLLFGLGWVLLPGSDGPTPEPPGPETHASAALETPALAPPVDSSTSAAVHDADLGAAEPVDVTAVAPDVAVPADESAPADDEATAPPADPEPQLAGILEQLASEWAAAWSSQDPERYLAFYAAGFVPDRGIGRSAWEGVRRQRLQAPSFVRVSVENLQVLELESDMPRTVFTQRYESNTFNDQVTKSLTWGRSDGSWRILSERSAP